MVTYFYFVPQQAKILDMSPTATNYSKEFLCTWPMEKLTAQHMRNYVEDII